MTTNDDMVNEPADKTWAGFDRFTMTDEENSVDVTIGDGQRWDRAHLRRLRQSADLPGLVPVIDADISPGGRPFAITASLDADVLASRISAVDSSTEDSDAWAGRAKATEAAARAIHEAHLRGLFHGGLSPADLMLVGDDVAVAGVGLGLGGSPTPEVSTWVAPEVSKGQDPTERSDVFSLGKILEAAVGSSEAIPRSIRRLIMWSTSDTPEARPPSALEFAGILNEALDGAGTAFGPAFIPTAELTALAARASDAVDNYNAAPTASDAGVGVAAVSSAAAAAGLSAEDKKSAEVADDATELSGAASATAGAAPLKADGSDDLPVATAAQTAKTESKDQRGGLGVPLLIGGLLALGLGAIGWALLSNNDETTEVDAAAEVVEDDIVADGEVETPSAPSTANTGDSDTEDSDSDTEDSDSAGESDAFVSGPIPASEAGVQILHGVPDTPVDVYVDETALVAGFAPSTVAGPFDLEAGDYEVTLYAAVDDAPSSAEDRSDDPVATGFITIEGVPASPATLVAHLDDDGAPTLTAFSDDLGPIQAGNGRIELRHTAEAPEVRVLINGEALDEELALGDASTETLEAGDYTIEAQDLNGTTLIQTQITVSEAEFTSFALYGSVDDRIRIASQQFTGLISFGDTEEANTDDSEDSEEAVGENADTEDSDTEDSDSDTEDSDSDTEDSDSDTEDSDSDTEDSDTEDSDSAGESVALVTGPIPASEAGVQILHGVPDTPVDVYVDENALVVGFAPRTVAGPIDLEAGDYEVALYAAIDDAPSSAEDRSDDPVATGSITVESDPVTVVAHLDEDGAPTLTAFSDDLGEIQAGSGRIELRHTAEAPEVRVLINGEALDEELAPGDASTETLEAGNYTIEAQDLDGTTLIQTQITVSEGEFTSFALYGSVDDRIRIASQRFTGLSSAPSAVPTGNSNLVAEATSDRDLLLVGALAIALAGAGAFVLSRQRTRNA